MKVSDGLVQEWTLPAGPRALLRKARAADMEAVRELYFRTYGDRYGLPEVADPEITARVVEDPSYLWLVTEIGGQVAGSVIFAVDPYHRLGKSFGGVIDPGYRGQKIMSHMIRQGHRHLLVEGGPCDLIYAVVRTFISLSFHSDLKELGYVDTGVFPNVRRVRHYETHGLKICPGPQAFVNRRRPPRLIKEVETLYEITRSRLPGLDAPVLEPVALRPAGAERVELAPVPPEEIPYGIESERERLRREGSLECGFFPLHEPNLLLADASRRIRAFLYYQPKDGHASLLGLTVDGRDRTEVLLSVGDACDALGVKYLELLVSAYDPVLQAQAYQAYFLPCAYFPAARLAEDGLREDYLVTSRTFVPLHFKGLKLTEDTKEYMLEFFKTYTGRLWEELMDA